MSFKFVASHVISGSTFSMIVNRTLQPQRSIRLQNCGVKRKSTQSCYSVPVSSVKESFPLVIRSHWISNCQDEISQSTSQTRLEPVSRFLSSLNKLAQPNVSLKKFEPSYRPIYPTSKSGSHRPTLKVKRKPPYIPAVFLRRNINRKYSEYYKNEAGKSKDSRKLFWPPLYKCKRKDNVKTDSEEIGRKGPEELPPWLLPLYSCKNAKNERTNGRSGAKFSGEAFRRKMDIMESMKQLQKKQARYNQSTTELKNNQTKRSPFKKKMTAVEVLKQRIEEMRENQDSFRRLGEYFRKSLSEDPLAQKDTSTTGTSYEPLYKTSKADRQVSEQNELEYISKEPREREPLKINLVGGEKAEIPNKNHLRQEEVNLSGAGEHKTESLHTTISEFGNSQVRKEMMRSKDEAPSDTWSIESLKTRIKDMRSTKDEQIPAEMGSKAIKNKSLGSENLPKLEKFAHRSYHKNVTQQDIDVGKAGKKAHKAGTLVRTISSRGVRMKLGHNRSTQGRRYFSTLRPIATHKSGLSRICHCSNIIEPKIGWLNRLKRCFLIKKMKGHKMENWKQTPRALPYKEKREEKHRSPSPILWVSKECKAKEEPTQSSAQKTESPLAEKVNPAVLNAEHRIFAGVNRLQASKHQLENPDFKLTEVEKKLKKAEKKVSIMPWTKAMNSVAKIVKPPNVRCAEHPMSSSFSLDEKPETGYEWILKNKDIVEGLKRKSQELAGKPLVPSHVKQAIDNFKLPLRAQISQYRRSLERKYPTEFHVYGTSRRWYSTLLNERKPYVVKRSHILIINTRKLNMDATLPGNKRMNTVGKNQRSEEFKSTKYCDHYKRIIESIYRPKQGRKVRDDINPENTGRNSLRARTKKLHKNRPSTPKQTLTVSPNRAAGLRINEISTGSLKKQVDELKQLIRKIKGPERAEDETVLIPETDNEYKLRLRRIVKAAHENAKKMQLNSPRYTSESITAQNKDPGHKIEPKRSASILQPLASLDKKKGELEKHFPMQIFSKHQEIRKPASTEQASQWPEGKKTSKSLSKVYSKLKSLVETVTGKSVAQEITSTSSTDKTIKSRKSLGTLIPTWVNKMDKNMRGMEKSNASPPENATSNLQLELQCKQDTRPSMSVQLWKGDSRLIEENSKSKMILQNNSPAYDELVSLLSKAKDLFTSTPNVERNHKLVPPEMSPFSGTKLHEKAVQRNDEDETFLKVCRLGAVESLLTIHKEVSQFTKAGMKAINSELKIFETKLNYQPITTFLSKPAISILPSDKASIIAFPVNVNTFSQPTKSDRTENNDDLLQVTRKDRKPFVEDQEVDYDRIWGVNKSLIIEDGAEEVHRGRKSDSQNLNGSTITPTEIVSSHGDPASKLDNTQKNPVAKYPNKIRSCGGPQTYHNSDGRGVLKNSTERLTPQKELSQATIAKNNEATSVTHSYPEVQVTKAACGGRVDQGRRSRPMAHAGNQFVPSPAVMVQPFVHKKQSDQGQEQYFLIEEGVEQPQESSMNRNSHSSKTCLKNVGDPSKTASPQLSCSHELPEKLWANSDGAKDKLSTSECDHVSQKEYHDSSANETENVSELLSKDPSINPDMVKKLKLPIPNDEAREKTWYTAKPYGL